MKRINNVADALNDNAADLEVGDGLTVRIPLGDIAAAMTQDRARLTGIEGRELPNRGRLYPLATAPAGVTGYASMDDVVIPGKYSIWTSADAAALGISPPIAGTASVFTYGNVVEQIVNQHGSTLVTTIARRKSGTTWNAWRNPGANDVDIAALVTEDTATSRAIKNLLPESGRSKAAAVALSTGDGGGISKGTNEDFRYPVKLAADVKRFRVHVQNANPRYGNKYAGALTFSGLGIARHAGEFDPAKEGQFAGPVTNIATGFTTNAGGFEYVSPWVENTPIKAYTEYLITGGYTCTAQDNFAGVGGGWTTHNAANWNVAAPAGLVATQSLPLYVWLEIEVDSTVAVGAWFGDSLASGVSARLGLFDSVANRHALAHGYIPTVYTNSGTKMADHADPAHFKWTRYDSAAPAKPNMVFWEMGSNDVFEPGATVEVMQSRFNTCWGILTSKLSSNIALMTILPRHDASSAQEPIRKAWNERLLTEMPGRATTVVDSAALLTRADGSTLDQRFTASPSDIHLSAAGYVRFMQGLPAMHGR